ncbi:MAG TPA: DUF885 domain-containing protein [Candidatus Elarobacter sp.]|jgi:hypothetical protein|nr:DUF885 domain-containing protein [Candidatus Elarobacter sp.]
MTALGRARDDAWIARSDELAAPVVELYALAAPESASSLGLTQADARTADYRPGWRDRVREAGFRATETLRAAESSEPDPRVREDIGILLRAVDETVLGLDVADRHLLELIDVPRTVFAGVRVLLDEQNPPQRKRLAVERLRRYAGLDGATPLAEAAETETRTRFGLAALCPPYAVEVRTSLALGPVLLDGIASLFEGSGLDGWREAFDALAAQCATYAAFVEREIVPRARDDHRLPPEVYADRLRDVGVDVAPDELARTAHAAFDAIQAEMQQLAPRVAAEIGSSASDYRDVARELKRRQIRGDGDAIVAFYRQRLEEIEAIVRRENIVTLPAQPARIRIASVAESAEMPAAHMNPAPLVGNTGQVGEFVLPLDVPPAPGGSGTERPDDFTHEAVSWTLTAHEARPGHEVQFDRMLERGLSLARAVFAFNSVNVEGWALYAEAVMLPHMPLPAQLSSLQMRLHRAARAFLDPELQSGAITPDEANAFLQREIVYSAPTARSEVERYTFRSPGQAASYFYGYTKLVALRAETEAALGDRFDACAFHDFILDQGLIPPDALRAAVLERFVPSAGATG